MTLATTLVYPTVDSGLTITCPPFCAVACEKARSRFDFPNNFVGFGLVPIVGGARDKLNAPGVETAMLAGRNRTSDYPCLR